MSDVAIVIPTAGRASLRRLLASLAVCEWAGRVILVDDRRSTRRPLLQHGAAGGLDVEVLPGRAAGPAAARNAGWRHARTTWVAFLDDDVVVPADWARRLATDLEALGEGVAGSQGCIDVPLPDGRRPTDWERNVAGLRRAAWATADMAYRRDALVALGGFDERFPRAYREDADLALRALGAGWRLERGARHVVHPVGRGGVLKSVRLQAGNADDVLMRALHGPRWRDDAQAPPGRLRAHVAGTAALACAPLAFAGAQLASTGRIAAALRAAGLAATAAWAGATAHFAWRRIARGPRTPREVATMALTSALIPPAATWHHVRGRLNRRALLADADRAPRPRPEAVLLDRDGTLVVDVPYNGDPARVAAVPGAGAAVQRLRRAGLKLAVVSNQSGVGRGLLTEDQVAAVNRRVEELVGPVGPWVVCPHAPQDGCGCRKPAPGLVLQAAELLGVEPGRCAVIGDIGADVEAARAAGARGILIPTPVTRAEEVRDAREVADDLESAVDLLLGSAA